MVRILTCCLTRFTFSLIPIHKRLLSVEPSSLQTNDKVCDWYFHEWTFLVRVILRIRQRHYFVLDNPNCFFGLSRLGVLGACLPQLLTKFNVSSSLLSANSFVLHLIY